MPCYADDLDLSVGFCFHSTLGQIETVHPIPCHAASGLGRPVRMRPRALKKTKPLRTGFNP